MPVTTIELEAGTTTPAERRAISDAIHASMIEVLAIPEDDRFHVFHELAEGCMFHENVAFGRPRSNRLKFITLSFNDRPAEQKRALFAALVRRFAEIGLDEDEFAFRVIETARDNWWASGRVVDPRTGYDERMGVPGPPD